MYMISHHAQHIRYDFIGWSGTRFICVRRFRKRIHRRGDRDDLQDLSRNHKGTFLGIPPTGKKIQFETVDAMRVHNGKIKEHWGVANLYLLMQQLGASTMTAARGL